jgi:hypothetical protein
MELFVVTSDSFLAILVIASNFPMAPKEILHKNSRPLGQNDNPKNERNKIAQMLTFDLIHE